MIKAMILAAAALTMGTAADAQTMIQKNDIKINIFSKTININ